MERFFSREKRARFDTIYPYKDFAKRIRKLKKELVYKIRVLKKKKKRIVGYGAPARGSVMLNYCDFGPRTIDYIVDSISYKQGRMIPGKHIPIFPEKKLESDRPDYVFLLAWNFADEILNKQKKFRKQGGKFIIPIPELRIV